MAAGMAIAGGVMAIGAIKSSRDIKRGASQQRDIDQANIERMKLENAETIKRTEESQRLVIGAGRTTASASGFGAGSSKQQYMDALAKTHAADLDWLKTSAASNVDIAGTEAAARYDITRRGADTALITGLGQAGMAGVSSFGRFQSTGGWWS